MTYNTFVTVKKIASKSRSLSPFGGDLAEEEEGEFIAAPVLESVRMTTAPLSSPSSQVMVHSDPRLNMVVASSLCSILFVIVDSFSSFFSSSSFPSSFSTAFKHLLVNNRSRFASIPAAPALARSTTSASSIGFKQCFPPFLSVPVPVSVPSPPSPFATNPFLFPKSLA